MNKIAYIFDLDDTLIKSDAKIYVYRNKAHYRSLTPTQYNTFVKEPGDVLDFRDFKDGNILLQAKKYKMWPLIKKLHRLIKNKKIHADILILTARSSEVKPYIYQLLKEDGIILDMSHIITMGDDRGDFNIADEKKKILEYLNDKYAKIIFFDDDVKNIAMANTIDRVKTRLVEGIKHLPPKSDDEINSSIRNLPAHDKVKTGIENDLLWLVELGIEEGANIDISRVRDAFHRSDKRIYKLLASEIKDMEFSTNRLEVAFYLKDPELAKKAISEEAKMPDRIWYTDMLHFLESCQLSKSEIAEFVKNNANNPQDLGNMYISKTFKDEVLRVANTLKANKLLLFAYHTRNEKLIEKAVKMGATNTNIRNNMLIQTAAEQGNVNFVKSLLKSPYVDPSDTTTDGKRFNRDESDYAIRRAAGNGHLEVVKLLLKDKRVDPTAINNYALRNAAKNGHREVVKLLLKDKRVTNSLSAEQLVKILKLI